MVNFIQEKYHKGLPLDTTLSNISFDNKKLDTFSSCLLPCDIPHHLIPVKATGDGDCFYNSASILLIGNESLSPVLRILIAAEIFLHAKFYAKHPRWGFTLQPYCVCKCLGGSINFLKSGRISDLDMNLTKYLTGIKQYNE